MSPMHIPGKPISPPDESGFGNWTLRQGWVTSEVEKLYKGATITWDAEGNPTLLEHYKDKVFRGKSRANDIMKYVIDLLRGYGVETTFFPDQAEIIKD